MSKYKYEGYGVVRDTEIDFPYHTDDIVELLDEKDQQISDLEAKLAEKDAERELDNSFWKQECDSLQKTLVEKDKLIEELKAQRRIYLNRSVEECNKITDLEFELQHKDQDKISFTIEQLEKVKEKALHFYVNDTPKLTGFYIDINEIDNQIKQLTHHHEDK